MNNYDELFELVDNSAAHINITSDSDSEEGLSSFLNIGNGTRYEFYHEDEALKVYYGDLVVTVNEDDYLKYIKLVKKENLEFNLVEKYHEDVVRESKIRSSI